MRLSIFFKVMLSGFLLFVTLGANCITLSPFPLRNPWVPHQINSTIARPTVTEAADLDGNSRVDVIAGYTDGTTGAVHIFFQTADDTFTAVQVSSSTNLKGLAALAVADMDADGHKDIIAACNERIMYLHSPADPTQSAGWTASEIAESSGTGLGQWSDVVVASIDGSHGPDLFASNSTAGRLCWFISPADPGSGTGWTRVGIAPARTTATGVIASDVDGDGRIDVISTAPGEGSATVAWYKNPTTPETSAWTKYAIGNLTGAARLALGDLNKDSRVDVVVTSTTTKQIVWYAKPSNPTGDWLGYQLADYTDNVPTDVKTADIDSNNQIDVVVATQTSGSLRWFTPIGAQTLGWGENNLRDLSGAVGRIVIADMDGDGKPDVVAPLQGASSDQDNVSWYKNTP